jgi:hypothetical protein
LFNSEIEFSVRILILRENCNIISVQPFSATNHITSFFLLLSFSHSLHCFNPNKYAYPSRRDPPRPDQHTDLQWRRPPLGARHTPRTALIRARGRRRTHVRRARCRGVSAAVQHSLPGTEVCVGWWGGGGMWGRDHSTQKNSEYLNNLFRFSHTQENIFGSNISNNFTSIQKFQRTLSSTSIFSRLSLSHSPPRPPQSAPLFGRRRRVGRAGTRARRGGRETRHSGSHKPPLPPKAVDLR